MLTALFSLGLDAGLILACYGVTVLRCYGVTARGHVCGYCVAAADAWVDSALTTLHATTTLQTVSSGLSRAAIFCNIFTSLDTR